MQTYLYTLKILLHNLLLALTLILCFHYSLTLQELNLHTHKPNYQELTQHLTFTNLNNLCDKTLSISINLYRNTFLLYPKYLPLRKLNLEEPVESKHFILEREIKPRKRQRSQK